MNDDYNKCVDLYFQDNTVKRLQIAYEEVQEYLEKNFINKFNEEELVKQDYYYGKYDLSNDYKLNFENKNNSYVGIPVVGDMHITDSSNVWLNNELSSSEKLGYVSAKDNQLNYISQENGSIFADFSTSKNYIRPVISLKLGLIISGGEGTKNNPLVIGELK